ncbi:MAG: rhomboid family intramembrane serine protease, partial [Bdellovibrio sp.]|nr:rhomboid family intramembrane serine protease [Bdellovibrio sp.]
LVGFSAAIYGLLTAYGLLFGERVLLFMMLFPMKAKHFVLVLALLELLTAAYSSGGGLVSLTQLSGMFFGFLYLWGAAKASVARRAPKKRKGKHLKLVVSNDRVFGPDDDGPPKSGDKPKIWH